MTLNDEIDIQQCTFSPIVQCEQMHISVAISKSLCLSQLLDDNQSITNMCTISRSQHTDQDFINILNNIWLFFNNRRTEYCETQSISKQLVEPLMISEPSLVHALCDKIITCVNNQ